MWPEIKVIANLVVLHLVLQLSTCTVKFHIANFQQPVLFFNAPRPVTGD